MPVFTVAAAAETTAVVIVTAQVAIAWSLWVRRITWSSRWESSVTLAIALQGLALLLASPLGTATAGHALHRITGLHNLGLYVGHALLMLSAAAIVFCALDKIYDDDGDLRDAFKLWVELPVTLGITGLFAVFYLGGAGGSPGIIGRPGIWMDIYWALFCGTLIYLLVYACRALLVVRRDWRQRRVADLYLVACVSGVLSCVTRLTTAFMPIDGYALVNLVVSLLGGSWLVGFALASAYSWRQKAGQFRHLGETVSG